MKKYLSILLCLVLVFQFTTVSWADTIDSTETVTPMRIVIPLSEDEEDVAIMQKSGLEKFGLEKRESTYALGDNTGTFDLSGTNNLTLNLTKKTPTKDGLIVSGTAEIRVGSVILNRAFTEETLSAVDLGNGEYVYDGVLNISIVVGDTEIPAYIDIVSKNDFSEIVANVSMGTIENNAGVMFFGEVFEEYMLYSDKRQSEQLVEDIYPASNSAREINSNDAFEYVGIATNKTINGQSGTGETVIISVGKRDFKDENASTGFEMIRIFGRSANVLPYVNNSVYALPLEATARFHCSTQGFLVVRDTTPNETDYSLPPVFDFLSSFNSNASIIVGGINLLVSLLNTVDVNMYKSTGFTKNNNATVDMNLRYSDRFNVCLPAADYYGDAIYDQYHGVACEFEYGIDSSGKTQGLITAFGKMIYEIELTNNRYTTQSTGEASLSHFAYREI